MKIKNPLVISASLLGLTLAMTGCTTTNANPTAPQDSKMMGEHGKMHGDKDGKRPMWQKDGKRDGKGMGDMQRMADLNLTDAQKAQMTQLRTQNQAKMQQFKAQLDQMDATIASQKASGATTATLLNLYKQKQALMDQFFAMHQQERQQFINLLTPDQQLKLYERQGHDGRGKGDKRPPMPMPAGTAQK